MTDMEMRYTRLDRALDINAEEGEESGHNPKAVFEIMYKQLLMITQYKLDILYWILMPLMWLIPFVWLGQSLTGGGESETFLKYTGSGDYLGFLLIGSMLWATLDSAIWGVGNSLRWEQQSGTLEYLWVSPVSRTDILTGQALGETGWVSINIIGQFVILSLVFGWDLNLLNSIFSLLALVIMFLGMLGFGFLFASVVMIFKEPGVMTELTDMLLFIVSPVRYPIQGLPVVLRFIAVVVPFTWGATIIRDLLIAQKSVMDTTMSFFWLLVVDISLWVVGYKVFQRMERRARRTGSLGSY